MSAASRSFSKCIGGVLVDRNGLVISSNIDNREFDENELALQAITSRKIVDTKNYTQVVNDLNENNKIMLLVQRDEDNFIGYRRYLKVIHNRNPFN